MRTGVVFVVGLALLLLPAAAPARTVGEVHILNPNASFTTKATLDNDAPLSVTISGTFSSISKNPSPGDKPCQFDAFYVFGCTFTKPVHPGGVFVGYEANSFSVQQLERAFDPQGSKPPAYRDDHKYTFHLKCTGNSDGCGRLRFFGGFDHTTDKTYKGSMTVEVGDDTPTSVRVDFSFIVTGKPNVAIRGADANLIGSRLTGSGHVTFTKRQGALLVGSESKGSIIHEDVLRGGKRIHLELGVITGQHGKALGTTYSPATGRLALLLKVKVSNDPACPASGFLTPTLVGLTLIPAGGVLDQAVLVGFPASPATEGCKGHAHAWKNGSGGVTVRVRATLN